MYYRGETIDMLISKTAPRVTQFFLFNKTSRFQKTFSMKMKSELKPQTLNVPPASYHGAQMKKIPKNSVMS